MNLPQGWSAVERQYENDEKDHLDKEESKENRIYYNHTIHQLIPTRFVAIVIAKSKWKAARQMEAALKENHWGEMNIESKDMIEVTNEEEQVIVITNGDF